MAATTGGSVRNARILISAPQAGHNSVIEHDDPNLVAVTPEMLVVGIDRGRYVAETVGGNGEDQFRILHVMASACMASRSSRMCRELGFVVLSTMGALIPSKCPALLVPSFQRKGATRGDG
jgi:hypothetical protein